MSKGEVVAESAVRFVRPLDAPPEKVWAFLTDSARLPEWYGDGSLEPREGGAVSLMAGHIRGVVTGWRPQKFLAYTWSVFQPGEAVSAWPISYVELTLESAGAATTLTLTHRHSRADAETDHAGLAHHARHDRSRPGRPLSAANRNDAPKRRCVRRRSQCFEKVIHD
jgi:uncharacterized protein YndB with AHSA1/START domain